MAFSFFAIQIKLLRMELNTAAKNNVWPVDTHPLGCVDSLLRTQRMISVGKLSDIIGISDKQLYAIADRGEIPHYRIGRSLRFDPAEVALWLRERSCGRRP